MCARFFVSAHDVHLHRTDNVSPTLLDMTAMLARTVSSHFVSALFSCLNIGAGSSAPHASPESWLVGVGEGSLTEDALKGEEGGGVVSVPRIQTPRLM